MKMKTTVKIAALIAVAAASFFIRNDVDAASLKSPINYSWEYTATTFYSDNVLIYGFSGLDVNTDYVWYIELTDENGAPTSQLGFRASTGSATYNWTFGGGAGNTEWPGNYTGPLRIRDNFGQILSWHFIAPPPDDEWTMSNGVTAQGLKQAPGVPVSDGPCRAAPYRDLNPDDYHHSYLACTSQVTRNDYFLLHYRLDLAEYGDGDQIIFYELGQTTAHVTFELDELIDNSYGGYSGGISEVNTRSFAIVNTGNNLLPFVDYDKSDSDFSTVAGNPHRSSILNNFSVGAYNCVRNELPTTFVSDCESPLFVSNELPIDPWNGSEWTVTMRTNPVAGGDNAIVALIQYTPEIWDSYDGNWGVFDTVEGYVDTVTYAFSEYREIVYPTTATMTESSEAVLWRVEPSFIYSFAASESDMAMIASDDYVLTVDQSAGGGIAATIRTVGFDTRKGHLFIFLFAEIIFVGITAAFVPRNFLIQLVVYTFVGANVWAFKLMDRPIQVLFVVSLFVMWTLWWVFMRPGRNDSQASM